MSARLPSLSPSGWVEDVAVKADKVVSYFLVAEASQSNWFRHEIQSFVEILRANHTEEAKLGEGVRRGLDTLLRRYFDNVDVDVTITENGSDKDQYGWNVNIDAVVSQDGKNYSLGRLVSTVNASVMKITNLNNTGA